MCCSRATICEKGKSARLLINTQNCILYATNSAACIAFTYYCRKPLFVLFAVREVHLLPMQKRALYMHYDGCEGPDTLILRLRSNHHSLSCFECIDRKHKITRIIGPNRKTVYLLSRNNFLGRGPPGKMGGGGGYCKALLVEWRWVRRISGRCWWSVRLLCWDRKQITDISLVYFVLQ